MSSEVKSQSLFSLVQQAQALELALIESQGELSPEIEQALSNIDVALPDKVDGYNFVMKSLEAKAEQFKAEAATYTNAAKSLLAAQERIKDGLKKAMQALGKDEIFGNSVRFKLSNAQPKLIIDEAKLPAEFKMVITTHVADKDRIKDALKEGFPIPGARLESSVSLRPYVNKQEGK